MNDLLIIYLFGNPQGQGGGAGYQTLIMFVLIIVVFYFFMIMPQRKKQKEIKKFRESIAPGDKVVTTGGIYGRIAEVKENIVILEVEGKMRLKIDKSVILRDSSDIEPNK